MEFHKTFWKQSIHPGKNVYTKKASEAQLQTLLPVPELGLEQIINLNVLICKMGNLFKD